MLKQARLVKKLVYLGLLLALILILIPAARAADNHAESTHNSDSKTHFQSIEQPLVNKIAVTLGGVGLISLELWWFLFSKFKTQKNDS